MPDCIVLTVNADVSRLLIYDFSDGSVLHEFEADDIASGALGLPELIAIRTDSTGMMVAYANPPADPFTHRAYVFNADGVYFSPCDLSPQLPGNPSAMVYGSASTLIHFAINGYDGSSETRLQSYDTFTYVREAATPSPAINSGGQRTLAAPPSAGVIYLTNVANSAVERYLTNTWVRQATASPIGGIPRKTALHITDLYLAVFQPASKWIRILSTAPLTSTILTISDIDDNEDQPCDFKFSPNGTYLTVLWKSFEEGTGHLATYNIESSWAQVYTVSIADEHWGGLAYSADSSKVVVGYKIYDVADGSFIQDLDLPSGTTLWGDDVGVTGVVASGEMSLLEASAFSAFRSIDSVYSVRSGEVTGGRSVDAVNQISPKIYLSAAHVIKYKIGAMHNAYAARWVSITNASYNAPYSDGGLKIPYIGLYASSLQQELIAPLTDAFSIQSAHISKYDVSATNPVRSEHESFYGLLLGSSIVAPYDLATSLKLSYIARYEPSTEILLAHTVSYSVADVSTLHTAHTVPYNLLKTATTPATEVDTVTIEYDSDL